MISRVIVRLMIMVMIKTINDDNVNYNTECNTIYIIMIVTAMKIYI